MEKAEVNTTSQQSTIRSTTIYIPGSSGARASVIVSAVIAPIILFILIVLLCVWINKKGTIDSSRQGKIKSTYEEFSKVDGTVMLRNSGEILTDDDVQESIPMDSTTHSSYKNPEDEIDVESCKVQNNQVE